MPKIIENAKQSILASARKIGVSKGLQNLTMREIASMTGLGVGTVYHYYPDKEAILCALLEEDWDKEAKEVEKKISASQDLDKVLDLLLACLEDFQTSHSSLFQGYKTDGIPTLMSRVHPYCLKGLLSLWKEGRRALDLTCGEDMDLVVAELVLDEAKNPSFPKETLHKAVRKLIA